MLELPNETPIVSLNIGELKDLIRDLIPEPVAEPRPSGHYVYGLRGIRDLLGVSHKTAQLYKDGFLKPAVKQRGRKIVVDADLALELFARKGGKRHA